MDIDEETLAVEAAEDGGGHAAKKVQSYIDKLKSEIERLTLTDEERAAIATAIAECESMPVAKSRVAADTLRALLERTTL